MYPGPQGAPTQAGNMAMATDMSNRDGTGRFPVGQVAPHYSPQYTPALQYGPAPQYGFTSPQYGTTAPQFNGASPQYSTTAAPQYMGSPQQVRSPVSQYSPQYPLQQTPYHLQHPMTGQSAAASFFARAAQKLNISSKKKRRREPPEPEPPPFPTRFSEIIHASPPPAPPCLLRTVGRIQNPGTGKVKVMLRIAPTDISNDTGSILSSDPRKKQVTVYDPSTSGYATSAHRRTGAAAPKMFAFDQVFSQDDSLTEICSSSLSDIIQSVVNGADGCLFCYGHSKLGKSYTMIGKDGSQQTLGIVPCAIAWLFRLINEQKDKTGARFSVRVSAVEVAGKQETLRDLLSQVASAETGSNTSPGVYLREDPICGTQLENQSELRAPTADKAAFYLDAACAARTTPDNEEESRTSHFLFTLHVYQYRVEKNGKTGSGAGVAGGRSRLHLIDLGSGCKAKDSSGQALSLSALGNVILALLNGQRHVPHRDSKLTQLLREALGSLSCRACMIAHVSPTIRNYNETLQVIQLAARIHRMRRRTKVKFSSNSSDDSSSCDDSGFGRRMRPGIRMGTLREGIYYSNAVGSTSGEDYTSSSEQSCDTVIYTGANGQALSDPDLTDNERPPVSVPIMPGGTRMRLPSGSGSGSDSEVGERRPLSRSGIKLGASASRLPIKNVNKSPNLAEKQPASTSEASPQAVQLPRKIRPPTPSKQSSEGASSRNPGHRNWPKPPAFREGTDHGGIQGEQWVDGPGAAIYPDTGRQEHWVDGPKAFTVMTQKEKIDSVREDQSSRAVTSKSTTSRSHIPGSKTSSGDLRAHVSKLRAPSSGDKERGGHHANVKERTAQGPGLCEEPSLSSDTEINGNDNVIEQVPVLPTPTQKFGSPLKNPRLEQIKEERVTAPCAHSDDNDSAHAHTLRQVAMQTKTEVCAVSNDNAYNVCSRQQESCPQEIVPVKPFVRDWVEKHSGNTDNVTSSSLKEEANTSTSNGTGSDYDNVKRTKSPKSQRSGHSSPRTQSPSRIPLPSSSSSRSSKLEKAILPPPANPSRRTADWIRSLSTDKEPESTVTADKESYDNVPNESEAAETFEMAAQTSDKASIDEECFMAPCTMEDKQLQTSPIPSDQLSNHQSETDSEAASNNQGNMSNRESIYELEVEEQLEMMRPGEVWRIAFDTSDYDTLSNKSTLLDGHEEQVNVEIEHIQPVEHQEPVELVDQVKEDVTPIIEVEIIDLFENQQLQPQTEKEVEESKNENDTDKIYAENGHSNRTESQVVHNADQSPPSSEDSDKSGKSHIRPAYFRRPDGASNPNLHKDPTADEKSQHEVVAASASTEITTQKCNIVTERMVPGQSADDKIKPARGIPKLQSRLPVNKASSSSYAKNKPPLPNKPSTNATKSPKPPPPAKPIRSSSLPRGTMSQPSTPAKSVAPKAGGGGGGQQGGRSVSVPASPAATPSPSRSSKTSKLPQKPSSTSSSTNSSPSRSSASPSRSRSKSPTSKLPTSKSRLPQSSSKASIQSSKDSKISPKVAKASPKKEKESKLPVTKASNNRVTELVKTREGDSDSGNDSGIGDKKLLSPYSTLTKARTSSHSSSGHGSDNSSSISGVVTKKERLHGGTSSGYESMIRDSSEITCTSSSTHDSSNESSASGWIRGNRIFKKRTASRRSKSAPARSDNSPSSCPQSPSSQRCAASPKAWVDTRQAEGTRDEPFELKMYDVDDVERMQRARSRETSEQRELDGRRKKIQGLMDRQSELKQELANTKDKLMVDKSAWSYDLFLASEMQRDDPHYLEALEKETSILEKRVVACKSHIMMVTCFDIRG
ncbi:kinesin-like protein KIF26B [Lingula anatina]|uniref:Kinesin-like protein KIF26B n=1 Tax=Lingula anatina TaxID=7574 RepID=A0A1S3HWK5_LINAN|nr:kinesin-like protein KIF26B [Lingula anatina]|eukprot:XP_013390398.1 kinesin-like protein KIF26B [Lingula anatina]